jgi:hypothetical protein
LAIDSAIPDDLRPGEVPLEVRDVLDRDALGEVAGLIDVAAAADGDVVGEELERDAGQERRQLIVGSVYGTSCHGATPSRKRSMAPDSIQMGVSTPRLRRCWE